jgi:hypothetical protein
MTVTQKPNINGGNYKAIDTKDGWYILRDMPCMSLVPKGIKNAPSDIGEDWMSDAVKFHQELYEKGKSAYPIHIGHNDDLGITHPEFAGFFKPTRVGKGLVEGKEQPVTFCDWKIKKSAFERFSKGELPFVSPEIRRWDKHKISSLALLDSQPPHFAFPLQTVGEVVEDPTAKFSADLPQEFKVERFSDLMERVTFDPSVEEDKETKVAPKEDKMADAKAPKEDFQAGKPNSNPVDQTSKEPASTAQAGAETVKLTLDDPRVAAKFAAMEDRNAALEKRLNERDAADKARELATKALESLRGYQIGDKAKAQISKFAAEGEEKLNAFVETLKEVSVKDSPRTFGAAEAASVSAADPSVAKFAQQGPDKLEAAARFATEYRTLKAHPAGRGMQITEEQYVKFQMDSAENPEGNHWGINFGIKN